MIKFIKRINVQRKKNKDKKKDKNVRSKKNVISLIISDDTAKYYRDKFNRSFYQDINEIFKMVGEEESEFNDINLPNIELFENIFYIVSYEGEEGTTSIRNIYETPIEFLDSFNTYDIYNIIMNIKDVYNKYIEKLNETR